MGNTEPAFGREEKSGPGGIFNASPTGKRVGKAYAFPISPAGLWLIRGEATYWRSSGVDKGEAPLFLNPRKQPFVSSVNSLDPMVKCGLYAHPLMQLSVAGITPKVIIGVGGLCPIQARRQVHTFLFPAALIIL